MNNMTLESCRRFLSESLTKLHTELAGRSVRGWIGIGQEILIQEAIEGMSLEGMHEWRNGMGRVEAKLDVLVRVIARP